MDFTIVPSPDPRRSIWDPEKWGTTAFGFHVKEKPHVHVEYVRAPEGMLVLCRCHRCTGLKDLIIDNRASGASLEADTMSVLLQEIAPAIDTFVLAHMACDVHPHKYELPGKVLALLGMVRRVVTEALADPDDPHVHPHLLLVFKDYLVECPIVGLPDYDGNRCRFWAEFQAALRDHLRALGVAPTVAVYVSESWMVVRSRDEARDAAPAPHQDPRRQEVINVHIATPTFTRSGQCLITRSVLGDEDSVATAAAPQWHDGFASIRLLDGLFALNDTLPQDDETKLRALGLPLIPDDEGWTS